MSRASNPDEDKVFQRVTKCPYCSAEVVVYKNQKSVECPFCGTYFIPKDIRGVWVDRADYSWEPLDD